MFKKYVLQTLVVLAIIATATALAAQNTAEQSEEQAETEIIIIETTTDENGIQTTTKTVTRGNFTDAQIDSIVDGEATGITVEQIQVDRWDSNDGEAFLGVRLEEGDEGDATIAHIFPGSPADRAGLQVNDRIISINDGVVRSPSEAIKGISSFRPGDEVIIEIIRRDNVRAVTVRLGEREDEITARRFRSPEKWYDEEALSELNEKMEQFNRKPRLGVNIEEKDSAVLITHVMPGSVAEGSGFLKGDLILEFNGALTNTTDKLIRAVAEAPSGQRVLARIVRSGEEMELAVAFPDE